MNCCHIREILNQTDFDEAAPCFDAKTLAHIDRCPACREDYQAFLETRKLLAALPPVEPVASFGPAWRARLREIQMQEEETGGFVAVSGQNPKIKPNLRQEVRDQEKKFLHLPGFFQNWRMVAAFGSAIVFFLLIACFSKQGWKSPELNIAHQGGVTRDAVTTATGTKQPQVPTMRYQVRIVKVGLQSKLVQRIIRDYHRSAEGGVSYTYREPDAKLATFQGLTLHQARTLKGELERAGAVVDLAPQK